jgi:hypothetical protein
VQIFVVGSLSECGYRVSDPYPDRLDPHYFWKLDPDPLLSQNSEALDAQNRAVEGRWRSQWSPGGSKVHWSRIRIELKSWIRIETNADPQHWNKS